ncbi:MAG: hypothetical protein L6420_12245 [Elusimicrobia bacterium]|nr:hypothetical protein [Elusimicrobiota bacterium]
MRRIIKYRKVACWMMRVMKECFLKNIYKLTLGLLISCPYISIASAKPVSLDSVQKVGQTKVQYEETKSGKANSSWTKSSAIYNDRSIKQVREITDKTSKKVLAYVLDLEPKGYIVISPERPIPFAEVDSSGAAWWSADA